MRKITLGIMALLCVLLVGCETGETNQETEDVVITDEEPAAQNEEASYYGTWKVWDYQSADISALSQEEVDSFKDYTLTYQADAIYQNGQDMNVTDPEYTVVEVYTEETLVQGYRANLGEWWNGVEEVSHVSVVTDEIFFGQQFFIVNDDVIWIYHEGVFFLARKVEK